MLEGVTGVWHAKRHATVCSCGPEQECHWLLEFSALYGKHFTSDVLRSMALHTQRLILAPDGPRCNSVGRRAWLWLDLTSSTSTPLSRSGYRDARDQSPSRNW